jgi:hypothetical protein
MTAEKNQKTDLNWHQTTTVLRNKCLTRDLRKQILLSYFYRNFYIVFFTQFQFLAGLAKNILPGVIHFL